MSHKKHIGYPRIQTFELVLRKGLKKKKKNVRHRNSELPERKTLHTLGTELTNMLICRKCHLLGEQRKVRRG